MKRRTRLILLILLTSQSLSLKHTSCREDSLTLRKVKLLLYLLYLCEHIGLKSLPFTRLNLFESTLSLVGRLTNPKVRRVWSFIPFLSDHRKCESRPIGADLGQGCFQFQLMSERDILKVLDNQPYHFAQCKVIIQRCEPSLSPSLSNKIPFWIQFQGIPLHLWSEGMLAWIAKDTGTVETTEVSSTVAMRVHVNGLQPLIKKTTLKFDDVYETMVALVYKKVHNHCTICFSLCHDKEDCPMLLV